MFFVKTLITTFLISLTILSASAQLVNTENSRKEKREGLQGLISFSYSFDKTTTDITRLQNNIGLQYTHKKHTFLILNNVEFMRIKSLDSKQDLANSNFQHLRYNYSIKDSSTLIWELFVQHQQNKIKYQDLRLVTGTGPRFKVINNDNISIYLCPLFMYEHEQEFNAPNELINTHVIKADFYAVLILNLFNDLTFRHITYYQPALYDITQSSAFEPIVDFRISSESSLSFKFFNDKLEFSTIFNVSHDSRPPGLYKIETFNNKMTFIMVKNEIKVRF
ncbi:MAG: DUF481 domain-containing protein [Salinivirgaceae bacterium]|nr:DUF481 domain-containing protein [Salinivirgaceae bacterium]MDY0279334.1 DUF481 domain-containing protein [Salinivirgaceae bacterium]